MSFVNAIQRGMLGGAGRALAGGRQLVGGGCGPRPGSAAAPAWMHTASAAPSAPGMGRVSSFAALASHVAVGASSHVSCGPSGRLVAGLAVRWHAVRLMSSSAASERQRHIRNIAIIAHVDHGKTTLVDCLLRQATGTTVSGMGAGAGADEQSGQVGTVDERVMDSNTLEKERGITILSKNTSIAWRPPQDSGPGSAYQINIVDTPGHADFGGEVERIMSMVDGVALVVCATDGPMTQTKFVLGKALKQNLRPIVVINKADRPTARLGDVENEIFDLFASLDASDEQMDYHTLYASARDGWCVDDVEEVSKIKQGGDVASRNMVPLFRQIVDTVPPPAGDPEAPFRMLCSQIEGNEFLGKCLIGRISDGRVMMGDTLKALDPDGKVTEEVRVQKVLGRRGLEQTVLDEGVTGDIVSIAGFTNATVRSTLCDPSVTEPIPSIPIDPPTMSVVLSANDSPLSGKEGTKVTFQAIVDRLNKESENNVSIQIEKIASGSYEVRGRGELQIGILLEEMRREGFEVSISSPQVVFRTQEGKVYKHTAGEHIPTKVLQTLTEPLEDVDIEVNDEHAGMVIEKMTKRKASMLNFEPVGNGRSKLSFQCPTRGLIGYHAEFQNDTRGSGILNHAFHANVPYVGKVTKSEKGALVSMASGKTTGFALAALEARGVLFVEPGVETYEGMIVGESSREDDMDVNPCKTKHLTNVRAAGKDEKVFLSPPRKYGIEESIAYIREDEMIEVTPRSIRLRKRELDSGVRARNARNIRKSKL